MADSYKYYYFANGLAIASNIFLPELKETADFSNPQVYIDYGDVPKDLSTAIKKFPLMQFSADEFLMDIDGIARYLVSGNNKVTIQKYDDADDASVRVFLLSSVFSSLMYKNDLLPMHASAIKVDADNAILIAGVSGSGKSTTALGFYERGYEILNDDISTIYIDENNNPRVYSGYSHLKLWPRSLKYFGYEASGFRKLRNKVDKVSFPLNSNNLSNLAIKKIFFLNAYNQTDFSHSDVSGVRLFDLLKKNTFRFRLGKELGKASLHFAICSAMAKKTEFACITRPDSCDPNIFVDYIEKLI